MMLALAVFLGGYQIFGLKKIKDDGCSCTCSVTCSGCGWTCYGIDCAATSWKCCEEARKITPLDCGKEVVSY